jgi:hypothetical protein
MMNTLILQFSPDINNSFQLTSGLVLLETSTGPYVLLLGLSGGAYCHFLEHILAVLLETVLLDI